VFINHAPVAANDAPNAATEDTLLTIDVVQGVLANDKDVNGDTLTAALVDGPAHGTLAFNADGSFSYMPAPNYNGADSFTYTTSDGHGGVSAPATVQLNVAAVNDAPVLNVAVASNSMVESGVLDAGVDSAVVQLAVTDIDSSTSFDTSDWTSEGENLFSRAGLYGVAMLDTAQGTVTYQLDNSLPATDSLADGVHVTDSFAITVTDGATAVSAPVVFTVVGANDGPYGKADHATVLENGSVTINVLANDGDVDGDPLSVVLGSAKSDLGATVALDHGAVHYSADADSFDLLATGASVTDRFTYTVQDAHGAGSRAISVTVTVNEAHDSQSLAGSNKADVFTDAPGHDTTYAGGNGDDVISGGDGADVLTGDNGNDFVDGGSGIDNISGGNGDDILAGGLGADILDGGNGRDILFGGAGNDVLSGGNGPDVFVFAAHSGRDTITDFRPTEDVIALGYGGNGSAADLTTFATKHGTAQTDLAFTDLTLDGNVHAVAVSGGALGDDVIVLANWTVADLVAQHFISGTNQVLGNWLI
jgi:VCBS repeat-containing protein